MAKKEKEQKGNYFKQKTQSKRFLKKTSQATVAINLPTQPKPQPKPAFKQELIGAKNFLFAN